MSDLAKCHGRGCTVQETCWRYRAPASERQSWFEQQPGCDHRCRFYWPTKEEEAKE